MRAALFMRHLLSRRDVCPRRRQRPTPPSFVRMTSWPPTRPSGRWPFAPRHRNIERKTGSVADGGTAASVATRGGWQRRQRGRWGPRRPGTCNGPQPPREWAGRAGRGSAGAASARQWRGVASSGGWGGEGAGARGGQTTAVLVARSAEARRGGRRACQRRADASIRPLHTWAQRGGGDEHSPTRRPGPRARPAGLLNVSR